MLHVLADPEELGVELDDVDAEMPQRVERRVAAAEIVHDGHEPHAAQLVDSRAQDRGVFDVCRFGHLYFQERWRKVILLDELAEILWHVDCVEISLGYVQRDRNRRVTCIDPCPQPYADLLPDAAVERGDEPVVLERRDELAGADHRAIILAPACKRLGADDLAR